MADDRMKVSNQQATLVFSDLIDSLIVDIATEAHRAARLGFDYKLNVEEEEEVRLAAHARAVVGDSSVIGSDVGNKHTVDVFGQTHPTIANETFECMNCGRPIVAGRFAPHLEKCMGKGRKARIKASRNMSASQQRRARSSSISSFGTTGTTAAASASRLPSRAPNRTLDDIQREPADPNEGESEESHDDDDRDFPCGLLRPGKGMPKKCSVKVWKNKMTFPKVGPFGLVPVPLHVSPLRASCAASVAGLAAADAPGVIVTGLTVEVAIQQFHSFVSGRLPMSGGTATKGGSKQTMGKGHVKSLKVGQKRKSSGYALTDSSSVKTCSELGRCDDDVMSKEIYSMIEVPGAERKGSIGRMTSNSSNDLHSHSCRSCAKDLSAEPCTADSHGSIDEEPVMTVAGRAGKSKGKSNARLGVGVDIGTWSHPQMGRDGNQAGRGEIVDFGEIKKRAGASINPEEAQHSMVASASGK